MGTREPRLQLSLQQALAGTAQPWDAGLLWIAGVLMGKQPCRPFGAQNSLAAEQMSKVLFESTGAALWAPVAVLPVPHACFFLWHMNLQREKKQGSTSNRHLQAGWWSVRLSSGACSYWELVPGQAPSALLSSCQRSDPLPVPATSTFTAFRKWTRDVYAICHLNTQWGHWDENYYSAPFNR